MDIFLDSDELYCAKKEQPQIAYKSLYLFIFFSPTKISVTDFSAHIGATVFKFCVHLQVRKVYCVNENEGAYSHFAFFFFHFFLLSPSYNTYGYFSVKDFSATTCLRILKFGTKLDSDEVYCVAKKKTATYCLSVPLFVHFLSLQ